MTQYRLEFAEPAPSADDVGYAPTIRVYADDAENAVLEFQPARAKDRCPWFGLDAYLNHQTFVLALAAAIKRDQETQTNSIPSSLSVVKLHNVRAWKMDANNLKKRLVQIVDGREKKEAAEYHRCLLVAKGGTFKLKPDVSVRFASEHLRHALAAWAGLPGGARPVNPSVSTTDSATLDPDVAQSVHRIHAPTHVHISGGVGTLTADKIDRANVSRVGQLFAKVIRNARIRKMTYASSAVVAAGGVAYVVYPSANARVQGSASVAPTVTTPPATPHMVVADATGSRPRAVAIDAEHVYFATDAGDIKRVPKSGGVPVTLSAKQSVVRLGTSAGRIYWTTRSGLLESIRVDGSDAKHVAHGIVPEALALDGARVYWADESGHVQFTSPVENNGRPSSRRPGPESLSRIAVCEPVFAWTDPKAMRIGYQVLGGGHAHFVPLEQQPGDIAVIGRLVIWSTYHPSGKVMVIRATDIETAPRLLADGQAWPSALVATSEAVYWLAHGPLDTRSGLLGRVALAAGAVETLAAGLGEPAGLVVDATSVYWTNAAAGSVMRMDVVGTR